MGSLDILLGLGQRQATTAEKEAWATRKNDWFVEYISQMDRSEIFPGVEKLFADLTARGIRLALASSSKNAPQVVQSLGIAKAFSAMVDGSMVRRAKPDPEIFLLAAHLIQVPAAHCVVVEDAAAGIMAARAAGMKCIGIGSPQQLGQADLVVATTGELTVEALHSLNGRSSG